MNRIWGAQQHVMEIFSGLKKEGMEIQLVSPPDFQMSTSAAIKRKIGLAHLTKEMIKSFFPDVVYFRYEGADILSFREVIHHKTPCIIELNTKCIPELWITRRLLPLAVSLVTEPWIFSNANGIAAVTSEIYRYTIKSNRKRKPFLLAKNGINLDSFVCHGYNPSFRKQYDTPSDVPLLVMIGSIAKSHGVDILLNALASPELNNFYLWLIGNIPINELKEKIATPKVLERVRVIPWQNPSQLSQTLSAADIGISSLALYRNRIKEAQALKTRAYLATGLPTLIGHIDTVISNKHPFISPGIYSMVEELALEIKGFHDFVMTDRLGLGNKAREYAENNLSWSIAAKETAEFIKLIYEKYR